MTPEISGFSDGCMIRPRARTAAIGVVLCKPFGYEAICSHRSIRAFAEALADAGFPTLRFDYLGTGDSGEIDPKADQLQVWTRDVVAAAGRAQTLIRCDADLLPGNSPRCSSGNACGRAMQNEQFSGSNFAYPERPSVSA